MGPIPSPTTKSDSPRVATVREQLYSTIIWEYVEEYIDDVHALLPEVSIGQERLYAILESRSAIQG